MKWRKVFEAWSFVRIPPRNRPPASRSLPPVILLWAVFLLLPSSLCADPFGDYWYQGKAEITSYDLEQVRYGEVHPGSAVMIFVTEDFSDKKHVKLDRPEGSPEDAVKVLKLNATRKFNTGIYTYSMMTSVFTPVYADQHPHTLKVTTTSQEWCGHTFTQLNRKTNGYRARQYSYFERESDRDLTWRNGIPEDEIWTRIRLSPDTLPLGKVKIIPGTIFQRLRHKAWGVFDAVAEKMPNPVDASLETYTRSYPEFDRVVVINHKRDFPHEIESWEEIEFVGRGDDRVEMTTRGTLKKRLMTAYWRQHNLEHIPLRAELGLDE